MFSQLLQVAPSAHSTVERSARRLALPHAPNAAARFLDAPSWQHRAIAAYQHSEQRDVAALQWELADRIAALTEQELDPATIYVNRAAQLAVVNVEGVVFRLQGSELAITRPCAHCGTGQFSSRALASVYDLGNALGEWEPRCEHCQASDPENWFEIED
jgi:hypothetical protein